MKKTVDDAAKKQKSGATEQKVSASFIFELSRCSMVLQLGPFCISARSTSPHISGMEGLDFLQDKKKAELDRQKELAELFAVAIKQPKVPAGKCRSSLLHILATSQLRLVG